MAAASFWRPKARTLATMAHLCWAHLLVSTIRFDRWRDTLGSTGEPQSGSIRHAKGLAADVEWAAARLPFATKCLPRAMALSWMLRRRNLPHTLVIAARPSGERHSRDALHAWLEIEGEIILGDLPGPWIESLRLGA